MWNDLVLNGFYEFFLTLVVLGGWYRVMIKKIGIVIISNVNIIFKICE